VPRRVKFDPGAQRRQHVGAAALLVMARLPCLATATPAAAATNIAHDEMLNVCDMSAPVPTTSSTTPPNCAGSICGSTARDRSSSANAAISSADSPFRASATRKSAFASSATASSSSARTVSATSLRERFAPDVSFSVAVRKAVICGESTTKTVIIVSLLLLNKLWLVSSHSPTIERRYEFDKFSEMPSSEEEVPGGI